MSQVTLPIRVIELSANAEMASAPLPQSPEGLEGAGDFARLLAGEVLAEFAGLDQPTAEQAAARAGETAPADGKFLPPRLDLPDSHATLHVPALPVSERGELQVASAALLPARAENPAPDFHARAGQGGRGTNDGFATTVPQTNRAGVAPTEAANPSLFDRLQADEPARSTMTSADVPSGEQRTQAQALTHSSALTPLPSVQPNLARLPVAESVFHPQWGEALGNRVTWLVTQEVQRAELRLNPPELGPIEVRIAVKNDSAEISFLASTGSIREAIEAAVPRLREMLDENNLRLVNVDVSDKSPEQQQGEVGNNGQTHRGRSESADTSLEDPGRSDEGSMHRIRVGLIDAYA